jgi:choline kinase
VQIVENAVIAAAGLGSRLGLGLPKCMLEIGDVTLLTRVVTQLESLVERIHVVVGYREEMIITHCRRFHPKVVIARNPEFRTTNTAQSLAIGARHLSGKTLFLDGDLLFSPRSLSEFVRAAADSEMQVGVTPASSDHAVFANVETGSNGVLAITGFSRTDKSDFEWANVFVGTADAMDGAEGYVYERLQEHLPLPARILELSEVDTEHDLARARKFAAANAL